MRQVKQSTCRWRTCRICVIWALAGGHSHAVRSEARSLKVRHLDAQCGWPDTKESACGNPLFGRLKSAPRDKRSHVARSLQTSDLCGPSARRKPSRETVE